MRVLWGTLAAGACGPSVLGDDTDGASDSSSSSTDATMSVGPDPTTLTTVEPTTVTPTTTIDPTGDPVCPTFDLGSSVPNSVSSVIDTEVDQFSGSCGGAAVD